MSLIDNFTVTETERENLKDGEYIGIIRDMSEKVDKYGAYINVEWEIVDPLEVAGRIENERFYIGSYDQIKKERAVYQFSIFCKQLYNLKVGEKLTRDLLIGRKAELTVKNNIADNGRAYQNIVGRKLLEAHQAIMYGSINISTEPDIPSGTYNDEVPF